MSGARDLSKKILDQYGQLWADGKSYTALSQALAMCQSNGWPMPEWLENVVWDMIDAAIRGERYDKEWDTRSHANVAKDLAHHYHRYLKVDWALAFQELRGEKRNLNSAFDLVEEELNNTVYKATSRAIKDSYYKVKADLDKGNTAKYYDVGQVVSPK